MSHSVDATKQLDRFRRALSGLSVVQLREGPAFKLTSQLRTLVLALREPQPLPIERGVHAAELLVAGMHLTSPRLARRERKDQLVAKRSNPETELLW